MSFATAAGNPRLVTQRYVEQVHAIARGMIVHAGRPRMITEDLPTLTAKSLRDHV